MDGHAPPSSYVGVERNPQISQLGPQKWLAITKIRNSQAQACGTFPRREKQGAPPTFIAIFIGFTFNYRYVEDAAAADDDGLAGLGGQSDGDSFHQDGKRKSSANKKEERRRLMRDDRFEEGVVIDHEDPYPTLHRGSKRDTSGYDQVDA